MKHMYSSRRVLALTVVSAAALLAACGGGESSLTPAQSFAARVATEAPVAGSLSSTNSAAKRMSVAAVAITNDQFFQWLQLQFPEVLGVLPPNLLPQSHEGKPFDVREFNGGTYLGIYEGRVFGLGPFTNGQLVDFGPMRDYSDQVCSRVNCAGTGTGGGTGGGNGTLNGCTLPASEALRVGNRYTAAFTSEIFAPEASTGEYTNEGVVEGSVTFEGQTAIKVSNRLVGTQQGHSIDATTVAYEQAADNGLTRSLGSETNVSTAGMSLVLRTVNNPAILNTEFTLQPGQSIDQTHSSTSTYINAPLPFPPTTASSTSHITYEARETINVLGRSFDTCRYKTTSNDDDTVTYAWHIYGKGIPARIESRNAAGALLGRNQLKSASINGSSF